MNNLEVFNVDNLYIPKTPEKWCLEENDSWQITETDDDIKGFTIIDNFDMDHFFKLIGINQKHYDIDYDS